MLPSKEDMRLRFWALKTAIEAAEADVVPLREAQSALRTQEADIIAQIRAREADVIGGEGMFDVKQELAFLARGLGNQVGENPQTPVS